MTFLKSAVVVVATAGLAACAPGPAPEGAAPAARVDATLVVATAGEAPAFVEAGGVVRAATTASIASRVLAPVVDVLVVPGDRVRRGQALVRLDARELEANRAGAAAALAAAEQAVHAADAAVQAADAARQLAAATHARIAGLREKRSATPQELDQAVAGLHAADAQAAGARAQAAQAASGLEAARAGGEAARVAASYAELVAPFDGIVTSRSIDPGTMATPGAPLLTLDDLRARHLEVRVDEARAAAVSLGAAAEVRLDHERGSDDPDAWIAGRVVEIARLDAATHSFLVKIELPASVVAPSGAFGRARFAGTPRPAITAPASAIVRRGQLAFVFAVDDEGAARLRPVSVGAPFADRVELLAGVRAGDRLVDDPAPSLVDGARVAPAQDGAGR